MGELDGTEEVEALGGSLRLVEAAVPRWPFAIVKIVHGRFDK